MLFVGCSVEGKLEHRENDIIGSNIANLALFVSGAVLSRPLVNNLPPSKISIVLLFVLPLDEELRSIVLIMVGVALLTPPRFRLR